jgi:hypothetical protein
MYEPLIAALEAELKKGEGEMRPIDVVIGEDLAPKHEVFACKEHVAFQDEGLSSITGQVIKGNYSKEVSELNRTFHSKKSKNMSVDGLPIMPPLVAGTLYQMAYHLDRVFCKHGIRYWADDGTILGMERYGGLIPHDDDVDVCLAPGEEEKLKDPAVIADLNAVGLEIVDHWLGAKLCAKEKHPLGCSMKKDGYLFNTPNVDLFFTQAGEIDGQPVYFYKEERARTTWPNHHYKHNYVFGQDDKIKRGDFGPIKLNTLWKGKEYCLGYYGPDCFSTAYVQYAHIREKGLKCRPVALTDFRLGPYEQWNKIGSLPK